MIKTIAIAILLCASACAAEDVAVTVKAVNMETGVDGNGRTYTWHAMFADVDGVTYKIGNIYRFREDWLHKGSYTGRWKNSKHTKLEVDFKDDGGKVKHFEMGVLGEE